MARISESELIITKDGSIYHLNLKPEHIADTVIAVGDPSRVYSISEHFDKIDFEMNKREFITHVGTYKGKRLTVISTGMGTDNIEIFMTELDALVNIDFKTREVKKVKRKLNIVRIGTSGALQEDIPIGSFIASEYGLGLDTLNYFYNFKHSAKEKALVDEIQKSTGLGFTPYLCKGSSKLMKQIGFDMVKGNTITSPGFYAPQGRNIRIPVRLPKLVRDLTQFHKDGFWLTNFEMETAAYYGMAKLMGHEMLSLNAIIANRVSQKFSGNYAKVVDDLIVKTLDRL
jgi:uridine phosphorylase